ncbi:hypothetical protein [Paraburkholderia sp. Cpub6]|uniref:hypothetical protein n=1 Tax=Paraburkholderia sp. Cpub6 TaxID=2723094 RepID=UPI001614606E|nr:hypothetical protein [Paraburkholderia sp. Cpub6]MBB5456792.1 hypothetical protein [Paraburkholderia sp. Cpub6]
MPFVSKPIRPPHRKRLTGAIAVIALCALAGACSDDAPPAGTNTISSTDHSAANPGDPSIAPPPADSAPPTLTIQTPAAPASEAGTALSATSPPLASPVIHTVD